MQEPALGHYRPWLEDMRKDKPYQLEDRIEQLFHEKSVTAYSAWNRLFDETIASLRFKVGIEIARDRAGAQSHAGSERGDAQGGFAGARQDIQGEPAHLRADHQYSRQGQGDRRPLARFRRRGGGAASCPTGSSPRWSMRWSKAVRAAYPRLSHRYYALKAKWFGKKRLPHWDRNAPFAEGRPRARSAGARRRRPCSPPTARSHPTWRRSRSASSRTTGSTRRCGPASRRAPSRIRPCRRRILMCCSTIRASRAT